MERTDPSTPLAVDADDRDAGEHSPLEIQRLLAWYYATEDPTRQDGTRDVRDAA
jgi:hypothetical protein